MLIKKIDIHVHSTYEKGIKRQKLDNTYPTPEELRKMYDKLGIEKGVQLPLVSPECGHYLLTNEESCKLAQEYPDMFFGSAA